MWVLFAFASAFFAGVTAILAKIGIKNVNSNVATAIRTIVILAFSWLMVFLTGADDGLAEVKARTLIFLVLSGFATGASWLCYFRALQLGDVNKVTPIDKSSTVMTMILALVILGEKITVYKLAGIILITVGTYMMITRKKTSEKTPSNISWIVYAFLAAVFASLTSILGKIGIENVNSNLGTAIRTIVVLIMAWILVFVTGSKSELKTIDRKSWLFIILSGVSTGLSWLCYYRALQTGEASIVVSIDKLSIVLTVAFSRIFLGERLTGKAFAGLILITAGTLTLLL